MPAGVTGGVAVRVRRGDFLAFIVSSLVVRDLGGNARVQYDDGAWDELKIDEDELAVGTNALRSTNRVDRNGWLVSVFAYSAGGDTFPVDGSVYVQALVLRGEEISVANVAALVASGYVGPFTSIQLGVFERRDFRQTWVFQGTVLEDATAGTHVSTLTVVPGAGQELEILYGSFIAGAGAANLTSVFVDDGTNRLTNFIPPNLSLASGAEIDFFGRSPSSSGDNAIPSGFGAIVSGTMRFIIRVSTATVSLTHTFAIVARIKGNALPTATLADTVGTPTLTTNTNAVFG